VLTRGLLAGAVCLSMYQFLSTVSTRKARGTYKPCMSLTSYSEILSSIAPKHASCSAAMLVCTGNMQHRTVFMLAVMLL
jgi:hypothetical protein